MCAMTLTEKIIARTAGKDKVAPGETHWVVPDRIFLYDWPGLIPKYGTRIQKDDIGVKKMPLADKTTVFIDHKVPSHGVKDAMAHQETRNWAKSQDVRLCEGKGIGHQVAAEIGQVGPGMMIAHFDTHVQVLGAFGALPLSFMADIMTVMALGRSWFEVPSTIRVKLEGEFQPGVTSRDLIHKIIADFGPAWAIGSVIEFVGPAAEAMSIGDRMGMLAQVIFTGAFSGVFPFDDKAKEYLEAHGVTEFAPVYTDPDAVIKEEVCYNLNELEPYIVKAPSPGNACRLADAEGERVDQGYIGSCASGRLEDIHIAAQILKGRKIKEGFRLFVVPSSNEMMAKAAADGSLAVLAEAGAFISSPSCDYCYGATQSLMDGERAMSTGTLNVPGRMGSVNAEIYQASAAAVAASAIEGAVADPRKYV